MILDFYLLANQCAPSVAVTTMHALATVESSLNPYAIGVVGGRLIRQPRHLSEATSTAKALQQQGVRFSAGIAQIYVGNWKAYNLDYKTVFDPCANMRAAAGILGNCYQRAQVKTYDPQIALRNALSCYYSNNFVTGYKDGYVQKVVTVALNQEISTKTPNPANRHNFKDNQ